jgi:hypothetical protein
LPYIIFKLHGAKLKLAGRLWKPPNRDIYKL